MVAALNTITPTSKEAEYARESADTLVRLISGSDAIYLRAAEDGSEIVLSKPVVELLTDILAQLAQGNPVALLPIEAEMTTHQAADLLGVSRPHLIKLLGEGKIAYRKVGVQRRVPLRDLLRYRDENKAARLKVLEELQAQAQELDMGY